MVKNKLFNFLIEKIKIFDFAGDDGVLEEGEMADDSVMGEDTMEVVVMPTDEDEDASDEGSEEEDGEEDISAAADAAVLIAVKQDMMVAMECGTADQ